MSGTACEFIGQKIQSLLECSSHQLLCQHTRVIGDQGINCPELQGVIRTQNEVLTAAVGIYCIPRHFENKAKQSANFVQPCTIELGTKDGHVKVDEYQYVPILKSLEALLKHDDVLAQVCMCYCFKFVSKLEISS